MFIKYFLCAANQMLVTREIKLTMKKGPGKTQQFFVAKSGLKDAFFLIPFKIIVIEQKIFINSIQKLGLFQKLRSFIYVSLTGIRN